jgi:hypothetical protein
MMNMAHGLTEEVITERILALLKSGRVDFTLLPPKAGWESDNPLLSFTKEALSEGTRKCYEYGIESLMRRRAGFARDFNRPLHGLTAAFIKSEVYHKDGKEFRQVGHIFGPKDHGRLKSTIVKRYWLYRRVVLEDFQQQQQAAATIQCCYRRRQLNRQRARRLEDDLVVEVPVDNWDNARVIQWLLAPETKLPALYAQYASNFRDEDIVGEELRGLTDIYLTEIGVEKSFHRMKILKAIAKLA